MWPFETRKKKAVVVFHIDHDGHARGAYFRGDADVLIIDERDPQNRVYRMQAETTVDEIRRRCWPANSLLLVWPLSPPAAR